MFVCRRTRLRYFFAGFAATGIMGGLLIWDAATPSLKNRMFVAIFCSILAAAALAWLWRSTRAASIVLEEDSLVYRTLVRSQVIRRSDIKNIQPVTRTRSTREWSQPEVSLNDGRAIYLTEFSVPPGPAESVGDSGLFEETEAGDQLGMIEELRAWLSRGSSEGN